MKKKREVQTSLFQRVISNKWKILFIVLFIGLLFTRFYKIEQYNPFGWDQVEGAWNVKHIIIDHNFILYGPIVKQNTGIYLGPYYYYYLAFFYWIFHLDPIASGVASGVSAIISSIIIYVALKSLLNQKVALIGLFINIVAFYQISSDRIEWNVDYLPAISLLIFYSLYKIITGNQKYLLLFATAFGFSLHIHFTAVFFPMFFILALPFFPRNRQTLLYSFYSLGILLIFLLPIIVNNLQTHGSNSSHAASYLSTYYHGFHLRRVLQIIGDAFIQFDSYLYFPVLKALKILVLPLFTFVYLYKKHDRNRLLFVYLTWLWFIIPWFVFATYKGEISDYYFSVNRFIALFMLAYLLYRVIFLNIKVFTPIVVIGLLVYGYINIQQFLIAGDTFSDTSRLDIRRQVVKDKIKKGEKVEFVEGVPDSYLYYYYTQINKKW